MKEEKFIVQNARPERKYFKVYYDFIHNEMLDGDEKLMFIILKSFLDFSMDVKGTKGEVFPTIQTICHITGWGHQKVIKVINSLVAKGVVKKIQRGLNKPNLYIIADYEEIWAAKSVEEVKEIVENDGKKPMTAEEHIAELKKLGYNVEIKKAEVSSDTTTMPAENTSDATAMPAKEKKSISAPNKVTDIDTQTKTNNTTNSEKSQAQPAERYTLDQLRQHFKYDVLIQTPPYTQNDIDSIISILYDALNTTKPTIRINKEDKPAMVVIAKLMKLNILDIQYAIDKFKEQTDKITNPNSYMLTILYNAKEQSNLDSANMAQHNKYGTKEKLSKPQGNFSQNKPVNQFHQFMQREVTKEQMDELERKLLQH